MVQLFVAATHLVQERSALMPREFNGLGKDGHFATCIVLHRILSSSLRQHGRKNRQAFLAASGGFDLYSLTLCRLIGSAGLTPVHHIQQREFPSERPESLKKDRQTSKHPRWRNHRIGKTLMAAIEQEVRSAGRSLLVLDTEQGTAVEAKYDVKEALFPA
jgi:GNAT superfamily N-acetyltransferase